MGIFKDRKEAGQVLARKLTQFAEFPNLLILALPRGGVPVAYEVAKELKAPLDIFLVRKLGVPGQEELAMGAIASGGARVFNHEIIRYLNIPNNVIDRVVDREMVEIRRREKTYRGSRLPLQIENRTVLLIDDGLATGASMKAAVLALRQKNPTQIIVAVPVASEETCAQFAAEGIVVICAVTPNPFYSVGAWYHDFTQTTDEEVCHLLNRAAIFQSQNWHVPKFSNHDSSHSHP